MTELEALMSKKINFSLTKRLFKIVTNKVKEGTFHSRGDYMRKLIRKDNLR